LSIEANLRKGRFSVILGTWEISLPKKQLNTINRRILEVRKELGLNQKEFAERIKVSRGYTGVLEATDREINDRIIELVCVNCGVNEKWLREGTGKMFKDKHNPRLGRVMRNFEKLDDYLQEYVIKQLDILVECQEKNKSNR
jgi:transcriptional regulator with XRE-family HTH domain